MNVSLKCLVFFVCSASTLSAQGSEDLFIAKGFNQYGGVKDYFENLGRNEINKLKFHPDIKISCYSAWLSCCLECQGLPKIAQSRMKAHKNAFINFLSGRLNSPVPDWWAEDLLLSGTHGYDGQIKWNDEFTYGGQINHSKYVEVEKLTSKEIELKVGTREFVIKWDQEDYWGQGKYELDTLRCISFNSITDDKYVYAISDDSKVLVCCMSATQGEIWKGLVNSLAQRSLQNLQGSETSINEIVISNGAVSVFSLNSVGASLGVFDLATGEQELSFTTYLPELPLQKKRGE